jgi:hypothetical protein
MLLDAADQRLEEFGEVLLDRIRAFSTFAHLRDHNCVFIDQRRRLMARAFSTVAHHLRDHNLQATISTLAHLCSMDAAVATLKKRGVTVDENGIGRQLQNTKDKPSLCDIQTILLSRVGADPPPLTNFPKIISIARNLLAPTFAVLTAALPDLDDLNTLVIQSNNVITAERLVSLVNATGKSVTKVEVAPNNLSNAEFQQARNRFNASEWRIARVNVGLNLNHWVVLTRTP